RAISCYLALMWQEDPFKAKWTLVAKAYSIVRDQVGEAFVPLGLFLQIVCPVVGLV
ncbi:mating-type protein MAT alpha 1, partial [Tothia fuscella]